MESYELNNGNTEEEQKVAGIEQGRFDSAMAEIEDADRLLLEGLDPEREGLGHIRESLMEISEPLKKRLLSLKNYTIDYHNSCMILRIIHLI